MPVCMVFLMQVINGSWMVYWKAVLLCNIALKWFCPSVARGSACVRVRVFLCKCLTDACLISVARSVKTAPRSLCTDIRCGSVDTSFCVCFFNGLIFHFPAKENTITQSSESRRAVLLADDSSSSSGLWFNYPNTLHKLSFSSFPHTFLELSVSFSDTHSTALNAFCVIGNKHFLW